MLKYVSAAFVHAAKVNQGKLLLLWHLNSNKLSLTPNPISSLEHLKDFVSCVQTNLKEILSSHLWLGRRYFSSHNIFQTFPKYTHIGRIILISAIWIFLISVILIMCMCWCLVAQIPCHAVKNRSPFFYPMEFSLSFGGLGLISLELSIHGFYFLLLILQSIYLRTMSLSVFFFPNLLVSLASLEFVRSMMFSAAAHCYMSLLRDKTTRDWINR